MSEASTTLVIGRRDLELARRDAEETYPWEGCGLLLGRTRGGRVYVERTEPALNELGASGRDRFAIAPEAVLAALRRARAEGWELVGIYHSHPDRAAVPSARDQAEAWSGVSQLIVPVAAGRAGTARSWRLVGRDFREETVEVREGGGSP